MDFDFKITTWERVNVSEEHEQEVLQAIKEGKITSANDVFDFLADKGDMNIECIKLTDTDEQMTVEEKGNDINAKQWFVKSDYQYELAEFDEGGFLGIDEDVVAEMLEDYYNFKLNQKFNKDDRR